MTGREDIFQALFALAPTVAWNGGESRFEFASRRVKLWSDLPAQPALCQAEHEEEYSQATRAPYKRTLKASWIIYHRAGADPDAVPASASNAILEAVEAAIAPPGCEDTQTLGGLVHHCFIDGKVFKDSGDLDQQALLIVPITILVP